MEGVKRKPEELGMCAAPGPAIEGYDDSGFEDVQPSGENKEVFDEALWADLVAAAEQEL